MNSMRKDLLDALAWRYATKAFEDRKIDEDTITRIVEAFNLTATSFNLQPVKLYVIGDKALQEQLTEASYGQKQVKTASHILVFCVKKHVSPDYIHNYFDREEEIRNTDPKILEPYRENLIKMFSSFDEERVRFWASNQAYLSMGNLLTFLAHEGVDSCPMEGFDRTKVDEILALDKEGLGSVLLLPIGYRDEEDFFASLEKVRQPVEDVVVFK